MLPYLTGLILVAYMASVKVYKIWYITTAAVLVLLPWIVRPSWSEIRDFFSDAKWFILYWAAVIVSVITSINPPRSQFGLMVDSIYPCVFLIFYFVALRSPYAAIERMMRLQVWAALAVLLVTLDIRVEERIGYRLIFTLPYFAPFVVAAICRGKRLAIIEVALLTTLILLTSSRAQIGIAFLLTAVSFIVFSTSLRQFLLLSAASAASCIVMVATAMQIEAARSILLTTVVRAAVPPVETAGKYTKIAGRLVQIPIDDHAREHISILFWSMFGEGGWTGIGYYAFGPLYVTYWHDSYSEMSLHSIYEVWWLETGYFGTAAAALMLIAFFVRMYRCRSEPAVKACTISAIGALIVGTVHQMHQAPMLYVMLGMGLGAARQMPDSRSRIVSAPTVSA